MKVIVNKINDRIEEISLKWNHDFKRDFKRNEGKVIVLKGFRRFDEDQVTFQIETDVNTRWHDGGYWNFSDSFVSYQAMFTEYKESSFPEGLFEI